VAPSQNVTGPFGTTVGEVTVKVNVTGFPDADGFADEASVDAVVAC